MISAVLEWRDGEPYVVCYICEWVPGRCWTQSPLLVDVQNIGHPGLLAGPNAWRRSHPFPSNLESALRSFTLSDNRLSFVEWVDGTTPILVYSPERVPLGLLKITDLVGDSMSDKAWAHGYEALASLDLDQSGYVEGRELASLYLWFDRNQDALAQSEEIEPVSSRVVRLAYKVTPDSTNDVSLLLGAQLLDGSWVRSWDWWMNVWVYPQYGSYSNGVLTPFLPPLFEADTSPQIDTPVMVYSWTLTRLFPGSRFGEEGTVGFFRFVVDPHSSDHAFLLLQEVPGDGLVADGFPATVVVASRKGNTFSWETGPEKTQATLLSDGTILGRTVSFYADYEWLAVPAPTPTRHPLAGLSDSHFLDQVSSIFDSSRISHLRGTQHLVLRGYPVSSVPVVPLR
jgi:hypothetical protein